MSQPGEQIYTVIGLWMDDEPVVAGVIPGEHGMVDADPCDERFQGRWATSVEAADPPQAERMAVQLMVDNWGWK